MPRFHAIVWVDHQKAQVLQFDSDTVVSRKVHAHAHYTRQHASAVRSLHEFFGEVCDALEGVAEVLVAGAHNATADFHHYVDKHRPQVASHILGYEVVDHPSENELVALARRRFRALDEMAGSPKG